MFSSRDWLGGKGKGWTDESFFEQTLETKRYIFQVFLNSHTLRIACIALIRIQLQPISASTHTKLQSSLNLSKLILAKETSVIINFLFV